MTIERYYEQMAIDSIKGQVCPQIEAAQSAIYVIQDRQRGAELQIPDFHPIYEPFLLRIHTVLKSLSGDKSDIEKNCYIIQTLSKLIEPKS